VGLEAHVKKNVEKMLEQLRGEEVQVREEAAWRLSRWGDDEAVEALTDAAWDCHSGVRMAARCALESLASPAAVRALVAMAAAPDYPDPGIGVELSGLGDAVVEPAIEVARDPRARESFNLVFIVHFVPEAAVPRLIEVLESDEPDGLRRWAIEALGYIQSHQPVPQALPALWRCVRRPGCPELRGDAASLLGEILSAPEDVFPAAIEFLSDDSAEVRVAGLVALAKVPGDRGLEHVRKCLGDGDAVVRTRAAGILVGQDDVAGLAAVLRECLRQGPVGVLPEAARSLVKLGRVEDVLDIVEDRWLTSEDPAMRRAGAACLYERSPRCAELATRLLTDSDDSVVSTAIDALEQQGRRAEAAVDRLCDLVETGGQNAPDAARALAAIGSSGATESLIAALSGPPMLAGCAAHSLGQIGDLGAIEPLAAATANESDEVAEVAAQALGEYGPAAAHVAPVLLAEVARHCDLRTDAIKEALAAMGPEVTPYLLPALGQPDSPAHATAVELLVRLGASAVPALIEALDSGEATVAGRAAWILGAIGAPAQAAVPHMTWLLLDRDDSVRVNAAVAMVKLGEGASARPILEELKHHDDLRIRNAARAGLKELDDPHGRSR
jgi:HEAT repeat protein